MALITVEGHVLQVNGAMSLLMDRLETEITGFKLQDLVDADDLMGRLMPTTPLAEAEVVEARIRHRNGLEVWVAMHSSFFSESRSTSPCLILQAQDVTARRHAESQLRYIAFHDNLTSLSNRTHFGRSLTAATSAYRDDDNKRFAIMYLDFDRLLAVLPVIRIRAWLEALARA